MATTSEVAAGLDDLAAAIRANRAIVKEAIANVASAVQKLDGLPTNYADLIATVQGYTGANAFEATAKSTFDLLTAEFIALVTAGNGIVGTEI